MATADPCKHCEKNCVKNGNLRFNIPFSVKCNGSPDIDNFIEEINSLINTLQIMGCPCCLGQDFADHARVDMIRWFLDYISKVLLGLLADGFFEDKKGCDMYIQLSDIDIQVKITCNNKDISEGKGDQASTKITGNFNIQVGHAGQCAPCNGSEDGDEGTA